MHWIDILVGIGVALVFSGLANLVGMDRDRAFYPTLLIVIASYYMLFAAVASNSGAFVTEGLGLLIFTGFAVLGFRGTLWWTVAALIGHGLFDLVHHALVANAGVPAWWPGFCLGYDVMAGLLLAALLLTEHVPAQASKA